MQNNYPHRARKRFGQNFLHDDGIIQRILHAITPRNNEHIVEIGPGQGALTADILNSGCRLDVIELDQDLIPLLKLRFGLNENFQLHQGDALKFDFSTLADKKKSLRIVGNLPYNISTPILFHLLDQVSCIRDMHFMLQKEVVERLSAHPGGGNWGRLSIIVQYYCQVENLFEVPPYAFNPSPKVDSAIVRLIPYSELPYPAKNVSALQQVVREAFNQRRKTLRNALKQLLSVTDIEDTGIDAGIRPEQLDVCDFVRLADRFVDLHSESSL